MKKLWFVLLMSLSFGAGFDATKFEPIVLSPYPNITTEVGATVHWNLASHIACVAYPGDPQFQEWSSNIPGGTVLNIATGDVSGVLNVASDYTMSVGCRNSSGSISAQFHLTITQPTNQIAEGARNFFVCPKSVTPAASDSNPGNFVSAPWENVPNNKIFQTGDDVYFCNDGQWFVPFTPDTSFHGSGDLTSQRAIIGAYYVSAGQPLAGVRDVPCDILDTTCFNWGSRPKFIGSHHTACRINHTCPVPLQAECRTRTDIFPNGCQAPLTGAIPSAASGGMISVNDLDYVTVQDLALIDLAGRGVSINPSVDAYNPIRRYTIVQRIVCYQTVSACIHANHTGNIVMRENRGSFNGLDNYDDFNLNFPATFSATFSYFGATDPSNYLIEHNTVDNGGGEGIGVYTTRGFVVAGNKISATMSAALYLASGSYSVVEKNIAVSGYNPITAQNKTVTWNGTTYDTTGYAIATLGVPCKPVTSGGYCPSGTGEFSNGIEGTRTSACHADQICGNQSPEVKPPGADFNIWRNNFVSMGANGAGCLGGSSHVTYTGSGVAMGVRYVGNTCIANGTRTISRTVNIGNATDTTSMVEDNILAGAPAGTVNCTVTPGAPTTIGFNIFQVTPAINCRPPSSGTIISLNTGFGPFNFATAYYLHMPTPDDFRTLNGSAGDGQGVAILDSDYSGNTLWWSEVQWAHDRMTWQPNGVLPLSEADWRKTLYAYYDNTPRAGSLHLGAWHQ